MNKVHSWLQASTEHDVRRLAPLVRESDRIELEDSVGQTPLEALEEALARSDQAYSMYANDAIICMGGVAPSVFNKDVGIAWFLASDALQRSAVALQFYAPKVIRDFHKSYDTLANFVDARNVRSAAWLERLGFKLVGTDPAYGVGRKPFHWFVKGNAKCAVPQ